MGGGGGISILDPIGSAIRGGASTLARGLEQTLGIGEIDAAARVKNAIGSTAERVQTGGTRGDLEREARERAERDAILNAEREKKRLEDEARAADEEARQADQIQRARDTAERATVRRRGGQRRSRSALTSGDFSIIETSGRKTLLGQ